MPTKFAIIKYQLDHIFISLMNSNKACSFGKVYSFRGTRNSGYENTYYIHQVLTMMSSEELTSLFPER